jgi:uncharacterized membrane protein
VGGMTEQNQSVFDLVEDAIPTVGDSLESVLEYLKEHGIDCPNDLDEFSKFLQENEIDVISCDLLETDDYTFDLCVIDYRKSEDLQ